MVKGLYAIRDTMARQVIGGIHVFAHEAAAVRFFGDIAGDAQTMVARHIGDHELVYIGSVNEETGMITDTDGRLVITGAAWKAAQVQDQPIQLEK